MEDLGLGASRWFDKSNYLKTVKKRKRAQTTICLSSFGIGVKFHGLITSAQKQFQSWNHHLIHTYLFIIDHLSGNHCLFFNGINHAADTNWSSSRTYLPCAPFSFTILTEKVISGHLHCLLHGKTLCFTERSMNHSEGWRDGENDKHGFVKTIAESVWYLPWLMLLNPYLGLWISIQLEKQVIIKVLQKAIMPGYPHMGNRALPLRMCQNALRVHSG